MRRRSFAHYRNGQAGSGWVKGNHRKSPACWMGEYLAAREVRVIEAHGGPCPIVSIFDPTTDTGVLIHITGGEAEQDGNEHEELIDAVMQNIGFSENSKIHVFFDLEVNPFLTAKERKVQAAERKTYGKKLVAYLKKKGFSVIKTFTGGTGKSVFLDTRNRRLWATNDSNESIIDITFD